MRLFNPEPGVDRAAIEGRYAEAVEGASNEDWADPVMRRKVISDFLVEHVSKPPAPDRSECDPSTEKVLDTYQWIPTMLMDTRLGHRALKYLLMVADPGSGKTFVVADFILKLIGTSSKGKLRVNRNNLVIVVPSMKYRNDIIRDTPSHPGVSRALKEMGSSADDLGKLMGKDSALRILTIVEAGNAAVKGGLDGKFIVFDEIHMLFNPESQPAAWQGSLFLLRSFLENSAGLIPNNDWHHESSVRQVAGKITGLIGLTATPIPKTLDQFGELVNVFASQYSSSGKQLFGGEVIKIAKGKSKRFGNVQKVKIATGPTLTQFLVDTRYGASNLQAGMRSSSKKDLIRDLEKNHGFEFSADEKAKMTLVYLKKLIKTNERRDYLSTKSGSSKVTEGLSIEDARRCGTGDVDFTRALDESRTRPTATKLKMLSRVLSGVCFYYSTAQDTSVFPRLRIHPIRQVAPSARVFPYGYPVIGNSARGKALKGEFTTESTTFLHRRISAENTVLHPIDGLAQYLKSRPVVKTLIFCDDMGKQKNDYTRDVFGALLLAKAKGDLSQPIRMLLPKAGGSHDGARKRYVLPSKFGEFAKKGGTGGGYTYRFHENDLELRRKAFRMEETRDDQVLNAYKNDVMGIIRDFNAKTEPRQSPQILVTSNLFATGSTFLGVREIHIMQGPMGATGLEQTIGRGRRRCSHEQYEYGEGAWKVDVFRWEARAVQHAETCETVFNNKTMRERQLHSKIMSALWTASFGCEAFSKRAPLITS
jgi:hypothetical protein